MDDPFFRPFTPRRQVLFMVALTLLAWATQTLLTQWARAEPPMATPPAERFLAPSLAGAAATLELRTDATLTGPEVRLRQICRWSDRDAPAFAAVADLVVLRLDAQAPYRTITMSELRTLLAEAGFNLASVHLAGAVSCTVTRNDVEFDEGEALRAWMNAREPQFARPAPEPAAVPRDPAVDAAATASDRVAAPLPVHAPGLEDAGVLRLRDKLLADLSQRLSIPVESLQVRFRPVDENLLNLSEPRARFTIAPHRVSDLGDVAWTVTIAGVGGGRRFTVVAAAQAWQDQLVVERPLAPRQAIRDEDLVERRVLVDRRLPDPLVTREQAVGQLAARELKPGTVLTSRLLDPVELVKPGQLVTIDAREGGVSIRTVARAIDGGTYGQSIRVRNESNRDVYRVTLTGPQTATLSGDPQAGAPGESSPAVAGRR